MFIRRVTDDTDNSQRIKRSWTASQNLQHTRNTSESSVCFSLALVLDICISLRVCVFRPSYYSHSLGWCICVVKLFPFSTIFPEIDRLAFLNEPILRRGPRLPHLLPLIVDSYAADLLLVIITTHKELYQHKNCIVQKMLCIDPGRRITVGDALRHQFFSSPEAAAVVHTFVPIILPLAFSQKVAEMVPRYVLK